MKFRIKQWLIKRLAGYYHKLVHPINYDESIDFSAPIIEVTRPDEWSGLTLKHPDIMGQVAEGYHIESRNVDWDLPATELQEMKALTKVAKVYRPMWVRFPRLED